MIVTADCFVDPTDRRLPWHRCRGVGLAAWLFLVVVLCWPHAGFTGEVGKPSVLERFAQAAQQGDAVAQTNLGAMYLHGVGVRRNLNKAYFWFQRAAEQEEGLAQFNMGVLCQEGQGTARDDQKAVEWFRRVASQPVRTDQFNPVIKGWAQLKLGFIYYEGRGVSKDYREALRWFKLAAERGIVMAQEMLGQMYAQGLGGPPDEKRAFFWYEQAALQGSRAAEKPLQEFSRKLTLAQKAEARTLEPLPQVSAGEQPPTGIPTQLAGGPALKGAPLLVVTNPADALVRILNIRPAYTPGIRLDPGKYHLEVTRKGYRPETLWVTVQDGELKVDVTLLPEGSPTTAAAPPAAAPAKPASSEVAAVPPSPAAAPAKPASSLVVAAPSPPAVVPAKPAVSAVAAAPSPPAVAPAKPASSAVAPVKPTLSSTATPTAVKPEELPSESTPSPTRLTAPAVKVVAPPAKPALSNAAASSSGKPVAATARKKDFVPADPPGERYALTVQTEPATAQVRVMNIAPRYQPGMLLSPGDYRLEVSHPGFVTRRLQVTMAQKDRQVSVALQREGRRLATAASAAETKEMEACPVAKQPVSDRPRQYGLTVQSDPEDAHIQILNIKAPYQPGISLSPGRYHVAIAKEAFKTRQCWAEIVDQDLDLAVALTPVAPGDLRALTIKPQPADATVRLLNMRTPYRPGMLLESGSYRVEVAKRGYKTEQRVVELGSRDLTVPIHLSELPLVARPTLTVVPVLQGVEIRILNADTPYRPGVPLAPGRYLLELSKPGFKTQQRWVELSEQDVKVEVALEESTGAGGGKP
ncbi:MAG: sel1 repeat family protein [Magnetococcus sp. YQC-3]